MIPKQHASRQGLASASDDLTAPSPKSAAAGKARQLQSRKTTVNVTPLP